MHFVKQLLHFYNLLLNHSFLLLIDFLEVLMYYMHFFHLLHHDKLGICFCKYFHHQLLLL